MKDTKIKVSVSQDGLLPQETAELAILEFPVFQKKLLKALGFERVDADTFVGVLPVFVHLADKHQEIEIELGVNMPEMRKKVLDVLKTPTASSEPAPTPAVKSQKAKTAKAKTAKPKTARAKTAGKTETKTTTRSKKAAPKKTKGSK